MWIEANLTHVYYFASDAYYSQNRLIFLKTFNSIVSFTRQLIGNLST